MENRYIAKNNAEQVTHLPETFVRGNNPGQWWMFPERVMSSDGKISEGAIQVTESEVPQDFLQGFQPIEQPVLVHEP